MSRLLGGVGCPSKHYEALLGGSRCLGDCYVRYLKKLFARLAVNIRMIALIAMPGFWYISTEFELKRNEDNTMHQCSKKWHVKSLHI